MYYVRAWGGALTPSIVYGVDTCTLQICLVEDDPNVLMRAKKAALELGCTSYAQPDIWLDQYVSVMGR